MSDDTVRSEAHAPAPARTRRLAFLIDRPQWLGPIMIAPAVIYIALVVGLPFLLALYYSFTNITAGSRTLEFVGLRNFIGIIDCSGCGPGLLTMWRFFRHTRFSALMRARFR